MTSLATSRAPTSQPYLCFNTVITIVPNVQIIITLNYRCPSHYECQRYRYHGIQNTSSEATLSKERSLRYNRPYALLHGCEDRANCDHPCGSVCWPVVGVSPPCLSVDSYGHLLKPCFMNSTFGGTEPFGWRKALCGAWCCSCAIHVSAALHLRLASALFCSNA